MAFNFFRQIFGLDTKPIKLEINSVIQEISAEIYMRELAYNICKNKIANAISKCRINVYEKGKKVDNELWYKLNYQPNINQNANQFFSKLIDKLYDNNECLVVIRNDNFYVADSFIENETMAFNPHTFENVRINNYTYSTAFRLGEENAWGDKILYFKLNEQNIKHYLDGTTDLYSKLIKACYKNYLISNGNKGFVEVDQFAEQKEDFEKEFNNMINNDFKAFFESENAIMPLYTGYKYTPLENKGNVKDTRDFKNLMNDILELTANALNVPVSLALGNVQDTSKAIDEMLTFCIDPLINILEKEFNRGIYEASQIIGKKYIKFDTKAIKHIDLLDVATSIDKLISSGFTCINDLREICGMDRIDEDWANQFFMTKNYSTIEDLMKELKGGGRNGE